MKISLTQLQICRIVEPHNPNSRIAHANEQNFTIKTKS